MARKHKHEEHLNAEAWAIPYGDLITLLLAFFVVMYSISSVNEGKYRTVAASLQEAFRGIPRTAEPVQIGDVAAKSSGQQLEMGLVTGGSPIPVNELDVAPELAGQSDAGEMAQMAQEISQALSDLIDEDIVEVRSTPYWLEVQIQTDLLFASGIAKLSDKAVPAIQRLADVLKRFPNPVRVEGHTDDLPIRNDVFPSNWELSAARAASVVHLLMKQGVDPQRLAVIGLGEYRPVADNSTAAGRNRNRRVVIVILANQDLRRSLENLHGPQAATNPVAQPGAPLAPQEN